jgi:photosystem II stability/assembly factor-like uncharacterized protein
VNKRTWVTVIGALTVLIGAVAVGGGGTSQPATGSGDMPGALSAHLDKLSQALPSNGGEGNRGPSGADAAYIAALAYPGTDIPLAQLTAASSAASTAKGRLPKHGNTGWASIGPSTALYPFSPLRTLPLYVPNAYPAAGRVTALALAPTCKPGNCRLWVGEATSGIWRTDNALANHPQWRYLSGSFDINSVGSITVDPADPTGNTLWVGTGEANACRSGCIHGVGLYKTTDGGNTWSGPIAGSVLNGRGTGSLAIDPRNSNVMYLSTVRAISGMSSVCCSGVERIVIPGAAPWGVYKTTDGGQTWSFIHAGGANTVGCNDPASVSTDLVPNCTPIGVRQVVLDPSNPDVVYASSYARGVWRSSDGGATWTQIKASLDSAVATTLPWIAVTTLANGHTRMYLSEGNIGVEYSRVFRSDMVESGSPVWSDLTSANEADPRWGSFNFCGGQCWYDNFVYTPKGFPDIVYVGGSYGYGENDANHRAVVLSTDAGGSWTDMTADGTDSVHPNALHPDQHVIVTNPNNPFQFWEGNDGGTMRSTGSFTNVSSFCTIHRNADGSPLSPVQLARCQQMLSRVPTNLASINEGITSLQFQSLSVSPFDSNELQGGTQDNGTWENYGKTVTWINTMIGDGGQSAFDIANPHFRTHTFAGQGGDVNFSDGALADWIWIGDPLFAEPSEFYVPWISDPTVSKTLFTGGTHVWRTKTDGQGTMTMAQFNQHCNEWTGDFAVTCGDWQPLGAHSLTSTFYGTRPGGDVVALARATNDSSTLYAATSTGRLFVSKNADAEPASAVVFNRIDSLAPNAANRFISSIVVDPANANHAWISYSGFEATSGTAGHVFEVTYNPTAGTATFVNLENGLGDLPITSLARDGASGTLFAGTDYGVLRLDAGASQWTEAASGMPDVSVAGLTLVPGTLYAATYGQGAWKLSLK